MIFKRKRSLLKRTDRVENGRTRRGDHLLMEMTTYYGMDKNPFIKDGLYQHCLHPMTLNR